MSTSKTALEQQHLASHQQKLQFQLGLLLIILLGAACRYWGLFHNTFHADEALFATYARNIAVWRDPMLLSVEVPVDKPPLLFYLQALFYPLQGPVEWAARLPNFIASLLLIPLVGRLTLHLTKNIYRGWLAAGIVAFSPIAIQFSATAFTDPLLTFWITLALWSALTPSKTSTGLWLGLGFLTKYQAILFLPLVLWLERKTVKRAGRSLLYFSTCIVALLLWDGVPNGQIDLFGRQVSAYGGINLVDIKAFRLQLITWLWLLPSLLGWGGVAVTATWVAGLITQRRLLRLNQTQAALAIYALGYVLLHLVIVNLSEPRYSLPLLPLLSISIASLPKLDRVKIPHITVSSFIAILLIAQAAPAMFGLYPFGGRPQNDEGAAAIAQTILEEPYGTVLYDHDYSWHWRYHLFYKGIYVEWVEDETDLLENLAAFFDPTDQSKRYLALKIDDPDSEIIKNALHKGGYRLELTAAAGKIELYLIRGD